MFTVLSVVFEMRAYYLSNKKEVNGHVDLTLYHASVMGSLIIQLSNYFNENDQNYFNENDQNSTI